MFDVDIRYKEGTDKENCREIILIAAGYDWIGVNHDREGDFSLMMGDKNLDGFCEELKKLDFVESVKLRKY
jgi:hypothetical protein